MMELPIKTYLWGTISTILYRPGQVQYLPNTQHCYQSQPVQKGTKRLQSGSQMCAATVSFAWICTAHSLKSWMQTSKTDRGPAMLQCTETLGEFTKVFESQMHLARSTSSAHTAVDDRNTTCTISTLALLKLSQWQHWQVYLIEEKK